LWISNLDRVRGGLATSSLELWSSLGLKVARFVDSLQTINHSGRP